MEVYFVYSYINKKEAANHCNLFFIMRAKGVEPLHLAALDPKSSASANSATPA